MKSDSKKLRWYTLRQGVICLIRDKVEPKDRSLSSDLILDVVDFFNKHKDWKDLEETKK